MANQGQGELLPPNHPVHADVQEAQAAAGRRDHQQYHLLDAARRLMLLGAAAAVSISTVCSNNPDDADAAQVFIAIIGILTWLLGVCLVSLMPLAAGRFPEADRLAAAAMVSAEAVLRRFFIPWN